MWAASDNFFWNLIYPASTKPNHANRRLCSRHLHTSCITVYVLQTYSSERKSFTTLHPKVLYRRLVRRLGVVDTDEGRDQMKSLLWMPSRLLRLSDPRPAHSRLGSGTLTWSHWLKQYSANTEHDVVSLLLVHNCPIFLLRLQLI